VGSTTDSSPEVVDQLIARFENADSFRNSEKLFSALILPLALSLSNADSTRICEAFVKNSQITYAVRMPALLMQLFEDTLFGQPKPPWKLVFDKLTAESDAIPEGKQLREHLQKELKF